MDKLIVYFNEEQDRELENLKRLYTDSEPINTDEFYELIKSYINAIRENEEYLEIAQINRDGISGALRRIRFACISYQNDTGNIDEHDEREILIFTFFHNAKCFIEII